MSQRFAEFLHETGWSREAIHKTFLHQVGSAHRKLMLEALGLEPQRDFSTLEWLGNTGSVALPITMACGVEQGFVRTGEHVGMLGIGSGINCLMLAVAWRRTQVCSSLDHKPAKSTRREAAAGAAG